MSKVYKIAFTNKSKKNIEDNFFCNICGFVLSSQEDIVLHEKYGCCHECFLTFAESRRESWKAGWRPKKVEPSVTSLTELSVSHMKKHLDQ
jgi:hypothetical protein